MSHRRSQSGSAASLGAVVGFAIGIACIFVAPAGVRQAYFSWIVFCAPMLGMLAGWLTCECVLLRERPHRDR